MADLRIEAAALIEKTPTDQLPLLGARVLHAWCEVNGTSQQSVAEFVSQMIQVEGHDAISDVLTAMLSGFVPATQFENID